MKLNSQESLQPSVGISGPLALLMKLETICGSNICQRKGMKGSLKDSARAVANIQLGPKGLCQCDRRQAGGEVN